MLLSRPNRSTPCHPLPTAASGARRNNASRCWSAVTLLATVFAATTASAAPPTIGDATASSADFTVAAVRPPDSYTPLMGSFLMFGADALDWTSYSFWRSLAGSAPRDQALQNMYAGYATVAGFPAFLLNEEIIAKFWVNLFGTAPDSAQSLFWTSRLNTYDVTSPTTSKGRVMADLIDFTMTGTAAALVRVRNRLSAAQMIKYETDTATEQGSTTDRNVVLNASRARLQPITDALSTRDAAVATLPRLRWVIEQNGIAPKATFDAASGELVVNGTEMLALTGANNDIDPTKLTLYGDGTAYPLTSSGVEITSATQFRITLNQADRQGLLTRLNRDGTSSKGNVSYLLAATPGWNTAYGAAQPQAALTGTRISVSNVALLNVDKSDATAYDAATDGVLLLRYLLGQRGAALIASARGTGTTLRDATAIETYLAGALPVFDVDGDGQTLPHTDGLMILRRLLNPGAATTDVAAMAAITAGAKRGSRSDVGIVNLIDALKP